MDRDALKFSASLQCALERLLFYSYVPTDPCQAGQTRIRISNPPNPPSRFKWQILSYIPSSR